MNTVHLIKKLCKYLLASFTCAILWLEVITPRLEKSHLVINRLQKNMDAFLRENIYDPINVIKINSTTLRTNLSLQKFKSRSLSDAAKNKKAILSSKNSKSIQIPTYGALNCPLEMSMFSNFNRAIGDQTGIFIQMAMESMAYSAAINAPLRVQSVTNGGGLANRKIIFLGDSLTRHLFISLGCLSKKIASVKIPWAPWPTKHPNDRASGVYSGYNVGRAKLAGGTDLIFYHIVRNLLTPPGYITPLVDNLFERYSWINSCRRREPFYILANPAISYGEAEIKLNNIDVVVLNAGIYPRTRDNIITRFVELLQCIDDARKSGTAHDDWPQFMYFITPHTHASGSASPHVNGCVDSSLNPGDEQQDRALFPKLVRSMLGETINWGPLARYHVGYGDCVHYTQMGVHDAVAAELAEKILFLGINTLPPASRPVQSPVRVPIMIKTRRPKKPKQPMNSICSTKVKCKGSQEAECKMKSPCCKWKKKKGKCKRKKKSRIQ